MKASAVLLLLCAAALIPWGQTSFLPDYFSGAQLRNIDATEEPGKLVFTQVVWRHGDRVPTEPLPSDKQNHFRYNWGQLTDQQMNLGKKLRQYLGRKSQNLVADNYDSKEIYVYSTDVNRTLMSALSNMVGFYQGATQNMPEGWPAGFVPVPIGNVDRECARNRAILNLVFKTEEIQKLAKDNHDFLQQVGNYSGIKDINIWDWWTVYDYVFILRTKNMTLPWLTDAIYDTMQSITFKLMDALYGVGVKPVKGFDFSVELPKVRGGPILWDMIRHLEEKTYCIKTAEDKRDVAGKHLCNWISDLKYYVYSAHDTTVAALISALGLNETNHGTPGLPAYATALSIELRQLGDEFFVKVHYWPPTEKQSYQDITALVSGCLDNCTLDAFVQRSKPYNPGNVAEVSQDGNLYRATVQLCAKLSDLPSAAHKVAVGGLLTALLLAKPLLF